MTKKLLRQIVKALHPKEFKGKTRKAAIAAAATLTIGTGINAMNDAYINHIVRPREAEKFWKYMADKYGPDILKTREDSDRKYETFKKNSLAIKRRLYGTVKTPEIKPIGPEAEKENQELRDRQRERSARDLEPYINQLNRRHKQNE